MRKEIPIERTVTVELSEIIDRNLEHFLDLLSVRATGNPLLMDIDYTVVGTDGESIKIKVTGDAAEIEADGEEW